MSTLLLTALLTVLVPGCTATPAPHPQLTFELRPSGRIRVILTPARWTLQPSALGGASGAPPSAEGEWPAGLTTLDLRAARGDLSTLSGGD